MSPGEARWLRSPRGPFEIRPVACPAPGPGEVVVRVRAVAVNPVDAITRPLRRIVTPQSRPTAAKIVVAVGGAA